MTSNEQRSWRLVAGTAVATAIVAAAIVAVWAG
jgi:hypothetical protein